MTDFVDISCGAALARVKLRGAELTRWVVGGDDLLWPGDPASWPDSAPLLFPVVGWTRDGIRVDGRHYPLGLHGFVRQQTFEIVAAERDRVTLALSADAGTRALFPFTFNFRVEYRIATNELHHVLHVMNEDVRPMPYAVGLHPGFRWPLPGATGCHAVIFDAEESAEIPAIAPGGLFSQEKRAVPLKGRRLELSPDLFREALCFLDANSRGLEFSCANRVLRMTLDNFCHIALWSLPDAKFLCLEAWTGHGDPVGFAGELHEKPSMRILKPGESARHAATFSWRIG